MSQSLLQEGKIFIGKSVKPEYLDLRLANRHGLITGATGTGKTVTLQVLAEGFSAAGVPVFAADIKGDLSGVAAVGEPKDVPAQASPGDRPGGLRATRAFPCVFWDVFGQQGHPIRATIDGDGPAAAGAAAGTQRDAGRRAQHRLPRGRRREVALVDLDDLRALLNDVARAARRSPPSMATSPPRRSAPSSAVCWCSKSRARRTSSASPLSTSTTSFASTPDGRGVINVLSADKLMETPSSTRRSCCGC